MVELDTLSFHLAEICLGSACLNREPHWKRRGEREFETVGVRMMWSTGFIGYVRIAVGDSYSVVDTFG